MFFVVLGGKSGLIQVVPWQTIHSFLVFFIHERDLRQESMGRPEGLPMSLGSFKCYLLRQRYRKVTLCARVQSASGLKVVAEVPLVMPFSTAHSTAL